VDGPQHTCLTNLEKKKLWCGQNVCEMIEDANQSTHCLSMCVCVFLCDWLFVAGPPFRCGYFLVFSLPVSPSYCLSHLHNDKGLIRGHSEPTATSPPSSVGTLFVVMSQLWMDGWMNKCQVPVCDDAAQFWACPFRLRAVFALNWATWFFMFCMSY
jgi:hypothetical protein